MSDKGGAGIKGVRTVAIPVTDQMRALKFYIEKLGFEKRLDAPLPQPGQRWIEVAPLGASTTIALVAARDSQPVGVTTGIRLISDDPARVRARFLEIGIDADALLLWEGVPPMFAFRDQDGNGLAIIGSTPSNCPPELAGVTWPPASEG